MIIALLVILVLQVLANAQEISPTGSTIEVESFRCTVTSPYTIQCINIGRYCVAARAEYKARQDRTFGCAIPGEKTYPCPKDYGDPNSAEFKRDVEIMRICSTVQFNGGY